MKQPNSTMNYKNKMKIGFLGIIIALSIELVGCGTQQSSSNSSNSKSSGKVIQVVGVENEYADILKQIGGQYVSVTAIINNAGTDPHSYESNTKDASAVSEATLIVQNGLGYDDFMDNLESSSTNSNRTVIDVSKALGYGVIAKNLETQLPSQKKYFESNLTKFNDSLKPFNNELNQIKTQYAKAGVAVTEPVSDYMLEAANLDIKTPWGYQASVMNGTDPSPQNVKIQEDLMKNKKVKVFIYNQQAIDDSTTALLKLAKINKIPIVGVYETMPPNNTYQSWMETEAKSILKALKERTSKEKIS
jgi:zinc/manganese transport system substrate-binding protein